MRASAATTTDRSESSASSTLSLRGSYPVVDFEDYVADISDTNAPSNDGVNFLDEGSCRGLGNDCLTPSVCCTGKCQAIQTVSLCVSQEEEVQNFAQSDARFTRDESIGSLLEEGSCRGLGNQCLTSSVCCSRRCATVPLRKICVP